MNIQNYFHISELVPLSQKDSPWSLFPEQSLYMLLSVREAFGRPISINGAGRQYCGWRPSDCHIGAKNSAHKKGLAFDLHTPYMDDLVNLVRKDFKTLGVYRIENPEKTKTWLHIDCLGNPSNTLVEFNP